jgi:GntR family transcriptional regulator
MGHTSLRTGLLPEDVVPKRRKPEGRREHRSKRKSALLAPLLKKPRNIPLHHQVFLVLQDGIAEGRYAPDEALPAEEELARRFDVSRVTIRAAMETLDALGLIERRQGVGTFVRELSGPQPLTVPMMDLLARSREIVRTTNAHVVEFGFEPAPRHVRIHFQAGPDDLFQRAVRIRHVSDRPIMQVTTYIPESIGRQFGQNDMEGGSLYAILQRFGITFASGEQIVTAAAADPVVAERLNVAIGAPLLKVVRVHFDSTGRPIQHFELLAPPATYQLRMPFRGSDLER